VFEQKEAENLIAGRRDRIDLGELVSTGLELTCKQISRHLLEENQPLIHLKPSVG
jgi:hypothetical protein